MSGEYRIPNSESRMRRTWDRLIDLVYPQECFACGASLDPGRDLTCAGCEPRFEWIDGPACGRCGAAMKGAASCGECEGRRFVFSGAVAAGMYDGHVRDLIHAFKFHRQVWLGRPAARRIADQVRRAGWSPDLIVPVPTRIGKIVWEGRLHGAPETLARRLSVELKRPWSAALRQDRATPSQLSLPRKERLRNPAGAYRVRGRAVAGRHVLLVDDVLTTGATADACARALILGGASDVVVAVAGR